MKESDQEYHLKESDQEYHLKWINFNQRKVAIVLQNKNGPCPIIALSNCLLLNGDVQIEKERKEISFASLGEIIANYLISTASSLEGNQGTFDVGLVLELIPLLNKGLDINVYFEKSDAFEFTPALSLFDLARIPLYHGWVIDAKDQQSYELIGKKLKSYNALIDCIVKAESCADADDVQISKATVCKEFLNQTASQLTPAGLESIKALIPEDRPSVLFRNNHFLTLIKRNGSLFTLLTDQGYAESTATWESFDSLTGSSSFANNDFELFDPDLRFASNDFELFDPDLRSYQETGGNIKGSGNDELDPDLLLALRLQDEEDERSEMERRRQNATSHLDDPSEPSRPSGGRNNPTLISQIPSTQTSSSSLESRKNRINGKGEDCTIL